MNCCKHKQLKSTITSKNTKERLSTGQLYDKHFTGHCLLAYIQMLQNRAELQL